MTRFLSFILSGLMLLAVGLGTARADEIEDVGALVKRIGGRASNYTKSGMGTVVLLASATDKDLQALIDIKPKLLSDLDLSDCSKLTDDSLQKLSEMPNLAHLKLPRKATDKSLKDLPSRLPALMNLHVPNTSVTASGLASLAGAKKLQFIDLSWTPVKDDCWKELAKLPALEYVRFYKNPFTGIGVKQLAAHPNLRELSFHDSPLTDKSLAELGTIGTLKRLQVSKAAITDRGVVSLANLKKLEELSLGENKITDAGLAPLAKLDQLRMLGLRDTSVTDSGLKTLVGLKKLEILHLNGTKVTEAGAKKLKQDIPGCTVFR